MKRLVLSVLTAALAIVFAEPVRAGQIYNGWNYAIDSLNDGSGGNLYEYRGLAYKESGGTAYFAISSGMPLNGNPFAGALNNNVGNGDLFINFSGNNLTTPASFGQAGVFAVRFDNTNDSLGNLGGSNTTLGVFGNLSVVGLSSVNIGYNTLTDYRNAGFGRTTDGMADLEDTQNLATGDVGMYLGSGVMMTNLAAPGRVVNVLLGGITPLTEAQLAAQGLDFANFPGADPAGNNIFGFSFNRNLLPAGSFTGHLFQECINDAMAIRVAQGVPEPASLTLLGVGALGALGLVRRRRQTTGR